MSLQDRTIFTDKQQLATDLPRSPRTVSPGEQWCKSICARRAQFHVPLGPQTFQLPQSLQDIGAIVPRAQGRICSLRSKLRMPLMSLTHAHTLSHTNAFTHRRFYTQTLLHTDAFTRRCFLHTHTHFHTQTLLHTDAFTHRRFYTQALLHKRKRPWQFYLSF